MMGGTSKSAAVIEVELEGEIRVLLKRAERIATVLEALRGKA